MSEMGKRCQDCGRLFATTASEEARPTHCTGAGDNGCLRHQVACERAGKEQTALMLAFEKGATTRLIAERDAATEGAAAEARRCDELLAERNRARNETIAALERAEAAEKSLEQATETVSRIFGALHDPFIDDERRIRKLDALLPLGAVSFDGTPYIAGRKRSPLNPESGAKGEGGGEG